MKILMVSDLYYPHTGGVSEHIYHLSCELIKKGHCVTVMAPHMTGEEDTVEIPPVARVGKAIPILANRSHSQVAVAWDIQKQVNDVLESGFDIIHIHSFVPVLPILALKHSNTRNVITVHAAYEKSLPYTASKRYLLRYFNKLHARIAVSKVAENSLSMFFPGRYKIIPNGVDINRFNPDVKPLPEFEGRFNILFVGRFEPRKGLRYLLSAFHIIKRQVPWARLIVVGSGRFEVPKRYTDDIILRRCVHSSLIPSYYTSADVFCSPATGNESFGIVLIEAMACGIPVVASSIAGYRCVIKNGENGILAENRNPQAIASAIIGLARDRITREELGKRGRQFATSFSWDKITNKVEEVYNSLYD
ncbi:glycosyltransferase family 4 protein [candidate division WOR-3 bacterium]|nr:glycosyltransferase family 4 protein [candidate division WOR-3 bacterium]